MAKIDQLEERVKNHINFFWVAIAAAFCWLAGVSVQLYLIKGDIGQLLPTHQLAEAASAPTDEGNIAKVGEILETAKRSAIKLPTSVVEQSGKAFIDAASMDPMAWNAALEFMNYRSTLNPVVRSVKTVNVPTEIQSHYDLNPVDGKPSPQLFHVDIGVAPEDAARFEKLGKNLNQQLPLGTPELIFTGGAESLDNFYARHVLFDGVEIHYTGRPVILEDVIFHNCTFVFDNTQPSRELGRAVLASMTVNFKSAA